MFSYSAHLVLHDLFRHKENYSEKEVAILLVIKQSECDHQKYLFWFSLTDNKSSMLLISYIYTI